MFPQTNRSHRCRSYQGPSPGLEEPQRARWTSAGGSGDCSLLLSRAQMHRRLFRLTQRSRGDRVRGRHRRTCAGDSRTNLQRNGMVRYRLRSRTECARHRPAAWRSPINQLGRRGHIGLCGGGRRRSGHRRRLWRQLSDEKRENAPFIEIVLGRAHIKISGDLL